MSLEVGQVLSLIIRFNNMGVISKTKHPYLIIQVDTICNTVEIAQLDSLKNKEYKAAFRSNKVIYVNDPVETVIDEDSFIQLDNALKLENFDDIEQFRRQMDKLSSIKLGEVLMAYKNYQQINKIADNKKVYITKEELLNLNMLLIT